MNIAKSTMKTIIFSGVFWLPLLFFPVQTMAGDYVVSVEGDQLLINNQPFKMIGLRCSNALMTEGDTVELIQNLDTFKSYGINTVSVFFMGSRFGDVQGYKEDSSLEPEYTDRMARIIKAADDRGMVVLVGCLYWGNSKAKAKLDDWSQQDANQAVANTVAWLSEHDFHNVIVDPDNEGMAARARDWKAEYMIAAAKNVDESIMLGYNNKPEPPDNADVLLHFSPKDGKRPYVESEGSAPDTPQGYWGKYSKEDGYYNYIRIGRYLPQMKTAQITASQRNIDEHNGYLFASTWLQCGPGESIGGPFITPGGFSNQTDVDQDVKTLWVDAGIRWWLDWVETRYGAWIPPEVN